MMSSESWWGRRGPCIQEGEWYTSGEGGGGYDGAIREVNNVREVKQGWVGGYRWCQIAAGYFEFIVRRGKA